jgi:hypothetical protein
MLRRCFEVLVGCALPWIAPWLIQASSSFGDAGYRTAIGLRPIQGHRSLRSDPRGPRPVATILPIAGGADLETGVGADEERFFALLSMTMVGRWDRP